MRYFPVFLDLKDKTVVLIGGGEEALRKARLFAKTEARLAVIAPILADELAAMPQITWIARHFAPAQLDGAALVCTTAPDPNVIQAAAERSLPLNVVDHPELSTFIVPSIVDRDPVVVAIGTEGTAPILGQGLRARFDALLPHNLGALAKTAGTLRAAVADILPAGNARRSFWTRLFFGDAGRAYLAGDAAGFESLKNVLLAGKNIAPQGRVSFVSAGAGDPELLALKAHRRLQEADVIVYDADVPPAVLELARRDAVRVVAASDFTQIVTRLHEESASGHLVVRLYLGRYAVEELANIAAEGVAFDIVPGTAAPCDIIPFPGRDERPAETLRLAS